MLQVSSCLSQPERIWYTSLKEKVGSCATGVKCCHNKQLKVINELSQYVRTDSLPSILVLPSIVVCLSSGTVLMFADLFGAHHFQKI